VLRDTSSSGNNTRPEVRFGKLQVSGFKFQIAGSMEPQGLAALEISPGVPQEYDRLR
jgi:hypothetical protein